MSETCDHVLEIINASAIRGIVRVELVRSSNLEDANAWRMHTESLFKCEFCPMCGEKLKTDEVPFETLVAMKEALEQEIAEREIAER